MNISPHTSRSRAHLMFRAIADPVRLRILHLLRGGESCVGDLVTVLDVPQPTASRHLRYLKRAGLARCRKQGLWCIYSLTPVCGDLHQRVLDCVELACRELPEATVDAERAQELKKSGGCCPEPSAGHVCRTSSAQPRRSPR